MANANAPKTAAAKLLIEGKEYELPDRPGHRGREGHRHLQPAQVHGLHHAGQGLREHRLLQERDHLHRRREGHPALPRLSHRGAGREVDLHGGRLPPAVRRAADDHAAGGVLHVPQRVLADPRGHAALLRRASPAARTPWASSPRWWPRCPPSTPSPRSWTTRPSSRSSPTSSRRCARSPPSRTRSPSASRSCTLPTSCATWRTS